MQKDSSRDGNCNGDSSTGWIVAISLYISISGVWTDHFQNAECPLFINKEGKLLIFSNPSQEKWRINWRNSD
jgi:hypothetical protein